MRPPGEVREALRAAFAERGASTWQEVVPSVAGMSQHSRADLSLVRRTVCNMVVAGELVPAGHCKVAGSSRWHVIYEAVGAADDGTPQPWGGIEALATAVKTWGTP